MLLEDEDDNTKVAFDANGFDELLGESPVGFLSENTRFALKELFKSGYLTTINSLKSDWYEILKSELISKMYIMGHRDSGTLELATDLNQITPLSAGSYITELKGILDLYQIELPFADSSASKLTEEQIISLSKTTTFAFLRKCQGGIRAIGPENCRYREGIVFLLPENLESIQLFTYFEFVILATLVLNGLVTCPVRFVLPAVSI